MYHVPNELYYELIPHLAVITVRYSQFFYILSYRDSFTLSEKQINIDDGSLISYTTKFIKSFICHKHEVFE